MRLMITTVSFALWAFTLEILGATHHVPNDYPLLQSAIAASGNNDTIVCDTVKDADTIKIAGKTNLVVTGPSAAPLTKITKVFFITNSTCVLTMLSFIGAKGLDGTNNFSCKSAPGLDGRPGVDAIIIDSSTVAILGCTVKGGDGGTYGVSYQGTMLCTCGSKGTPGTALRADNSTISLLGDSLLPGYCAGTSIAGCFTNTCSAQGYGCAGLNGSTIDTINSIVNSLWLDSTSRTGVLTRAIEGGFQPSSYPKHSGITVSMSGTVSVPNNFKAPYTVSVYNARGKLLLFQSNQAATDFSLANKLPHGIFIISLLSHESRLTERVVISK